MANEFVVDYPFVRTTYEEPVLDCDGMHGVTVKCWKPGTEFVPLPPAGEDVATVAHGIGKQRLTVISRHKPGKYPERVFYVRQWVDPDGKAFGKPKLRITTAAAFAALCRGYRYEYELQKGGERA